MFQQILRISRIKNDFSLLPESPGVYFFLDGKKNILYVGKAKRLKNRIRSYFISRQSAKISGLLSRASLIGIETAESEIDALLRESELIKRFQPKFNKLWKDDTSYFYVLFSDDEFPRLTIAHEYGNDKKTFGPFTEGASLKKTLRLLRKIYPYCTCLRPHRRLCLQYELGLCFGWCCSSGMIPPIEAKKIYTKSIEAIRAVLSGKSDILMRKLGRAIYRFRAQGNSEAAEILDKEQHALKNVLAHKDVQHTKSSRNSIKILDEFGQLLGLRMPPERIEAFDVSNFSGKEAVGSMAVFINGEVAKNEFRKFKIKSRSTRDDPRMIYEIVKRRLSHSEWKLPEIILIDGGKTQFNAAKKAVRESKISKSSKVSKIKKIIALAKPNKILYFGSKSVALRTLSPSLSNFILRMDRAAHNFAIRYHRTRRKKILLQK